MKNPRTLRYFYRSIEDDNQLYIAEVNVCDETVNETKTRIETEYGIRFVRWYKSKKEIEADILLASKILNRI